MTADDGLRLDIGSPAINFGDQAHVYNGASKDVSGADRIVQGTVDAGAYESWGCAGLTTLYVDAGAVESRGDGSSWATAFRTLTEALNMANLCPDVDSILVAAGT